MKFLQRRRNKQRSNSNDSANDDDSYRLLKRSPSDDSAIQANNSRAITASSRRGGDASSSIVDSLVDATKKCNRIVVDNCTVCTDYMDKQVQYEVMQQAASAATSSLRRTSEQASSGTFDIKRAMMCGAEEQYHEVADLAATMFDEQSVVESVISR